MACPKCGGEVKKQGISDGHDGTDIKWCVEDGCDWSDTKRY